MGSAGEVREQDLGSQISLSVALPFPEVSGLTQGFPRVRAGQVWSPLSPSPGATLSQRDLP